MPGPGNYSYGDDFGSSSVKYKAPSFKIEGKRRYLDNNGIPGPGTYDEKDGVNKAKTKSTKFGQSSRDTNLLYKSIVEIPGPGNYNGLESKKFGKEAVSVSIGGKPKQNKDNGHPGPGAYDQRTKESAFTYKMGSSQR
mmetsp:Transcript_22771/g.21972  ORF Transcript_22771/g.21972 Transcript_22771/m.21972 type:complete len:138 (-) Transcript_22771:738-1151(-)